MCAGIRHKGLTSIAVDTRAGWVLLDFKAPTYYYYVFIIRIIISIIIRLFTVYYIFSICSISAYMGAQDWQKKSY
jgi:hypothetical protein